MPGVSRIYKKLPISESHWGLVKNKTQEPFFRPLGKKGGISPEAQRCKGKPVPVPGKDLLAQNKGCNKVILGG